MKILIINVVCGIKSTGRICTDIAEELENAGHTVRIAYGRDRVPDKYKKYAVRVGNDFDVSLHALKSRLFDSAGFESRFVTGRFIKWMESYDPDIIHLNNLHGYYINVEILFNYLKHSGKKIIWTLHDCWAFSGHSALCDADGCEKWKEGCGRCPQKAMYPKTYIDRSAHNWRKKKELFTGIENLSIVVPSHWMEENIKASFLKEYPVTVINNGIDTEIFRNKREYWNTAEQVSS